MTKTANDPDRQWADAVRLALAAAPDPPAGLPEPPDCPEAVLEWLPRLLEATRVQCAATARKAALRAASRGWLRGQGARKVVEAVESVGRQQES